MLVVEYQKDFSHAVFVHEYDNFISFIHFLMVQQLHQSRAM